MNASIIDRRTFLIGVGAAALPSSAQAFGLSAGPDLLGAVNGLSGAREGSGPLVRILFAPWCQFARKLYIESRGFTSVLSFVWMPFSGGLDEAKAASEALLMTGDPGVLRGIFSGVRYADGIGTPLCDQQDRHLNGRVASIVARDIGRAVVSPMLVYTMGRDRVRVVPGAIRSGEFSEIARIAS
ncbi:hypothetical protein [Roseibium sp. RKSG952]|uniref:hypothetical protein n=1 Tax=Roseibium sp. RKSG952 TaxID=2529384 RepID=UPI0012BCEC9F|nr:hypothetical protein [Roseibium sp. RKSG952]MTH95120.1 hypothetical protein [Roseibium sp. RKSG952]